MATDIFMPIDLKSRSASVLSWLSTRKLTCAIALILSDVVHCSKCAFQRQADSGVCRTPTAGRLRYHFAWLRENQPRNRSCTIATDRVVHGGLLKGERVVERGMV